MGNIYLHNNDFKKSLEFHLKALEIDEQILRKESIVRDSINTAYDYSLIQDFENAEKYLLKAAEITKELKDSQLQAEIYSGFGSIYQLKKDFNQSLKYYMQALNIYTEINDKKNISNILYAIGFDYYYMLDFKNFIKYFNDSVNIIEELRKTAVGDKKRDFIQSQIVVYKMLSTAYIYDNQFYDAFDILEKSRTRFLLDQMTSKQDNIGFAFSGIKEYQKKLDNDTAIISYCITPDGNIAITSVDRKNINSIILICSKEIQSLLTQNKPLSNTDNLNVQPRGLYDNQSSESKNNDMEVLIKFLQRLDHKKRDS